MCVDATFVAHEYVIWNLSNIIGRGHFPHCCLPFATESPPVLTLDTLVVDEMNRCMMCDKTLRVIRSEQL